MSKYVYATRIENVAGGLPKVKMHALNASLQKVQTVLLFRCYLG